MDAANTDQMVPEHDNCSDVPEQMAVVNCDEFPFVLPIPRETDDLEVTVRKLNGLAGVVRTGQRLVLTTGVASNPRRHNAEAFAKERMTAMELAQYEEWKEQKSHLPDFDWTVNQVPVPPGGLNTFSQRAAAMDILWQRQGATPENAAWLNANIPRMMPLVKAITKLLAAQTHLERHNQWAPLSDNEIAELHALRMIIALADKNLACERERLRKLAKSVHESVVVLQGRIASLRR
ncbi:uncharacterized protein N7459_004373 [Penicillium hispanicum]|uniref:uncharacterized protein n=1 Tax=Penicillium hispanicum TaxID=1080232 RepID=UPI00253FBBA1|nr:uncharacterized protein N7459_004373 [Penicillium hispanicum]KAJ5584573.1 hypothetical protein N7459_004373 [Penicillium hispanicum]